MITKFNFKDRTIKSYAIRKLTPKECFRLMGVRDGTIRMMQSTSEEAMRRVPGWDGKNKPGDMAISASQQYKQAGNSIVVDVLKAIYEQLWYPRESKYGRQMSLFEDDTLPPMPVDANKGEKVIVTSFSGYDSQLMAADALKEERPDFRWTCMGWSDIDKYVCQMHNLVFPQYADKALGDITKIDWGKVKDSLNGRQVDLFTYSSPCQDISQAGKQMGLQEGSGTRSSLLWHIADAIETLKPKYLLQENVAALVSKKFMPDFQRWLGKLENMGYVNRWAKLNAKDYGVPQNRDRVFCLSIRRDVAFDYQFPEGFPLQTRLEDVLEEEVAERYFLKDDAVLKFLKVNDTGSALFLQSALPPTHEAAMFLKTWYECFMSEEHGWEKMPEEIGGRLNDAKEDITVAYGRWLGDRGWFDDDFIRQYEQNMRRKPKDAV